MDTEILIVYEFHMTRNIILFFCHLKNGQETPQTIFSSWTEQKYA